MDDDDDDDVGCYYATSDLTTKLQVTHYDNSVKIL